MSSEDSASQTNQLQSLIADFLAARRRGEEPDRHELIESQPELADSLRDFFTEHDKLQLAADTPTLAPDDIPTTPPDSSPEATELFVGGSKHPEIAEPHGKIRSFGDYELLDEIARGGMGVVFRARQRKLNRIVALKMILAGQFAGEKDVQRFHTEAEAAAQLDHPGIVPIFEIGQNEGQHYFSMGYVEGESLAEQLSEGPLPPRTAAELVQRMSQAMAYAHSRGVIHRDLKPANVLIDESGQPKITDFGLAKKTEAESELTGTGQILGTPAYMPPEQASGDVDEVGPLADVYSLGALLYCLLTGRPPFQAASPMDILRQVLDQDPIPARQLVPTIPRDLDTICRKCLSKDPAKRYASAADLAADLQRFLDDEPILARPAGRVERASKWASKQPIVAAILLTLPAWLLGEPKIGVGLLALIAGFHLPFRFRFVRLFAALVVAVMATLLVGGISYLVVQISSDSAGSMAKVAAISLLSSTAPLGVVLLVFLFDCVSELERPGRRQARWLLLGSAGASLLCIAGYLYYLGQHSEQISMIVDRLADEIVSLTTATELPDAESASSDAMVQLFRSRMVLWIPVFTAIVWVHLVVGIIAARLIRPFVYEHDRTTEVAHSRHRSRLVKTVDGDVSRWVAIAAAVIVAVLPDAVSRLLGVYDIELMKAFELGNPLDSGLWVIAAAWLAAFAVVSRRRFLIASAVGACLLLFLSLGTVDALRQNRLKLPPSSAAVAASDSFIQSFDGHTGPVKWVDVDPSGKLAVSVSGWPEGDGTVRVWNLESGELLWVRHLGPEQMMAASFTRDGNRLVAARRDGTVFIWEVETARELKRFKAEKDLQGLSLFSEDRYGVIVGESVQVWDLETTEMVRELEGIRGRQLDVSLSGDGRFVATGGADESVHVWELETGKEVSHIRELNAWVESVALNQDGSRVFVALNGSAEDPLLMSVSVSEPDDRSTLKGHTATVNWVRYSADGRFLVSAGRDKSIRIWNPLTGSEIDHLEGHQDWVWSAVFTPDGQRILSGGGGTDWQSPGSDWSLRLWRFEPTSPTPVSESEPEAN